MPAQILDAEGCLQQFAEGAKVISLRWFSHGALRACSLSPEGEQATCDLLRGQAALCARHSPAIAAQAAMNVAMLVEIPLIRLTETCQSAVDTCYLPQGLFKRYWSARWAAKSSMGTMSLLFLKSTETTLINRDPGIYR